jgi:hypothetical protein
MDEITATAAPDRSRGRHSRRLRRLVIGLAMAACALVLGTGTASAGQLTYNWSPYIHYQEWQGYFGGDCTIRSGPVYDPYKSSYGFAAIGGGWLSCATPHTYQIWVQEYFSPTQAGPYYQKGTTGYYAASNYGTSAIVGSGRACGTGWWFTRVTVSASGYTPPLHFDEWPPAYVAANGYSASLC